jgi:hypothetical protein
VVLERAQPHGQQEVTAPVGREAQPGVVLVATGVITLDAGLDSARSAAVALMARSRPPHWFPSTGICQPWQQVCSKPSPRHRNLVM